MNENKNEIPGLSMANIKMDLARFQDDILKDIRTVQFSLADKYTKIDDYLKERITAFENKINSFEKKITELSNLIITDNSIREKIKSLEQFKEYINDTLFKRRAKFNELEKYTNDEINRINNILTESIIYPSIIGKVARFKSFHEFIDYVLDEISNCF
jgi:DNA repair exonuclease SbcCD ATPase subunit